MEHKPVFSNRLMYIVIGIAAIALIVGAIGLIAVFTYKGPNQSNNNTPNSQSLHEPGGSPGPTDNPIYRSQGSSDSATSGTEPHQLDNN